MMPQWEFWLRVVLVALALVLLVRGFDGLVDCFNDWRRRMRR